MIQKWKKTFSISNLFRQALILKRSDSYMKNVYMHFLIILIKMRYHAQRWTMIDVEQSLAISNFIKSLDYSNYNEYMIMIGIILTYGYNH